MIKIYKPQLLSQNNRNRLTSFLGFLNGTGRADDEHIAFKLHEFGDKASDTVHSPLDIPRDSTKMFPVDIAQISQALLKAAI